MASFRGTRPRSQPSCWSPGAATRRPPPAAAPGRPRTRAPGPASPGLGPRRWAGGRPSAFTSLCLPAEAGPLLQATSWKQGLGRPGPSPTGPPARARASASWPGGFETFSSQRKPCREEGSRPKVRGRTVVSACDHVRVISRGSRGRGAAGPGRWGPRCDREAQSHPAAGAAGHACESEAQDRRARGTGSVCMHPPRLLISRHSQTPASRATLPRRGGQGHTGSPGASGTSQPAASNAFLDLEMNMKPTGLLGQVSFTSDECM